MPGGRPRKSELQHAIDGTRPFPLSTPGGPAETGDPKMPIGLMPDAKKLWKKVIRPWMVELDSTQLGIMCQMYALYLREMKAVVGSPTLRARNNMLAYLHEFNSLAGQFGLNPASRAKLPKMMAGEKKSESDDFFNVIRLPDPAKPKPKRKTKRA